MEEEFVSETALDTSTHMLSSVNPIFIRKESARGNSGALSVVPVSSNFAREKTLAVKGISRHGFDVGESSKQKSVSSSGSEESSKTATSTSRRLVKKDEFGNKRPIQIVKPKTIMLPSWSPQMSRELRTRSVLNPCFRPYAGEKNPNSSRASRAREKPAVGSESQPPRKSAVLHKVTSPNSRAQPAVARAGAGPSGNKPLNRSSTGKETYARKLEASPSAGKRTSATGFSPNPPALRLRAETSTAKKLVPSASALAGERPEVRSTQRGSSKQVNSVAFGRSTGLLLLKSPKKFNLSTYESGQTKMMLASSERGKSQQEAISSLKLGRPSTSTGRTDVKLNSEMQTAVSEEIGELASSAVDPKPLVPVATSSGGETSGSRSESYEKIVEEAWLLLADEETSAQKTVDCKSRGQETCGKVSESSTAQADMLYSSQGAASLQDHRRLSWRRMNRSPAESPPYICLELPEEDSKSCLCTHPKLKWKAAYRRETSSSTTIQFP